MTTYASDVHLTPYVATMFLRVLKDYVAGQGGRYPDAIIQQIESQLPGSMRIQGWPHHLMGPVEWALEKMGEAVNAAAIYDLARGYERSKVRGVDPTEAQALAMIWVRAYESMTMTSTSSSCWPTQPE